MTLQFPVSQEPLAALGAGPGGVSARVVVQEMVAYPRKRGEYLLTPLERCVCVRDGEGEGEGGRG